MNTITIEPQADEADAPVKNEDLKVMIIIPARMASKRLPGKPLLEAAGKALVHWTWEQARKTRCQRVLVATPDREIARYCKDNGIPWRPTRDDHPNGTHRCMEILEQTKEDARIDLVVNWQVDEPTVTPSDARRLLRRTPCGIATMVYSGCLDTRNRNLTKVAYSYERCHWFSRDWFVGCGSHIGLYAFSPFMLRAVCELMITRHSEEQGLEQLTWLERGFQIAPVVADFLPRGINSSEDWEWFKKTKEGEENE